MRNVLVAAVCLSALLILPNRAVAIEVGDKAASLNGVNWLQGKPTDPPNGGRIHIVEFWATWCGPCLRSIPHLNELAVKHKDRLSVIGVTNEDPKKIAGFMKKTKMVYNVVSDQRGVTRGTYMKGVRGIPFAVLVNHDGKVAWKGHPMGGLDQALAELLAQPAPKPKVTAPKPALRKQVSAEEKAAKAEKKKQQMAIIREIVAVRRELQKIKLSALRDSKDAEYLEVKNEIASLPADQKKSGNAYMMKLESKLNAHEKRVLAESEAYQAATAKLNELIAARAQMK